MNPRHTIADIPAMILKSDGSGLISKTTSEMINARSGVTRLDR